MSLLLILLCFVFLKGWLGCIKHHGTVIWHWLFWWRSMRSTSIFFSLMWQDFPTQLTIRFIFYPWSSASQEAVSWYLFFCISSFWESFCPFDPRLQSCFRLVVCGCPFSLFYWCQKYLFSLSCSVLFSGIFSSSFLLWKFFCMEKSWKNFTVKNYVSPAWILQLTLYSVYFITYLSFHPSSIDCILLMHFQAIFRYQCTSQWFLQCVFH